MDVKKLGGCLHKLGVKYDRPLFELATKAFDEDQSGLIEFDEFVEMFATLRASDELALGDFGAPSAELTAQELSDVKASFDAIDADGSGAIDEGEVKALFEKVGLDATDKEIRGLVEGELAQVTYGPVYGSVYGTVSESFGTVLGYGPVYGTVYGTVSDPDSNMRTPSGGRLVWAVGIWPLLQRPPVQPLWST